MTPIGMRPVINAILLTFSWVARRRARRTANFYEMFSDRRWVSSGSEMELWFGYVSLCVCVLVVGNRMRLRRLGSPGAAGVGRQFDCADRLRRDSGGDVQADRTRKCEEWLNTRDGCVRAPHVHGIPNPTRGFHRQSAPSSC